MLNISQKGRNVQEHHGSSPSQLWQSLGKITRGSWNNAFNLIGKLVQSCVLSKMRMIKRLSRASLYQFISKSKILIGITPPENLLGRNDMMFGLFQITLSMRLWMRLISWMIKISHKAFLISTLWTQNQKEKRGIFETPRTRLFVISSLRS